MDSKPRGFLITGFEPFGDQSINASSEVVSRLPKEIEGTRIMVSILPVVYYRSIECIQNILKENDWITDILLLGEAGGISRVRLEMIGVNYDDTSLADNEGVVRTDKAIYNDAPDGLFATIPVKKIVRHLTHECKFPAYVSWSAGQFLCNHTLFGTAYHASNDKSQRRVGFVHLPYTLEQAAASDKPGLSVAEMTRCIEHIIRYMTKN